MNLLARGLTVACHTIDRTAAGDCLPRRLQILVGVAGMGLYLCVFNEAGDDELN